jgi:hypothetical protein
MLYYCRFDWHPGTTRLQVARRFMEQHETARHHTNKWRGWYALAGGGAGFIIVETDNPRDLTEMFQPYMDLMSWDVRPIYELAYEELAATMREVVERAGPSS